MIDLNQWHRGLHQVTGDMALRSNSATAADLERWAKMLREVAEEMGTEAREIAQSRAARLTLSPPA